MAESLASYNLLSCTIIHSENIPHQKLYKSLQKFACYHIAGL